MIHWTYVFAELIVKTFKCHSKLHIKIKQNTFSFPIWRRFVHTFYAFDNSQETVCLRRVKILNLCLTSIEYETFIWIFIAFLSSLGIKWQHFILSKGKVTDWAWSVGGFCNRKLRNRIVNVFQMHIYHPVATNQEKMWKWHNQILISYVSFLTAILHQTWHYILYQPYICNFTSNKSPQTIKFRVKSLGNCSICTIFSGTTFT